MGRGLRKHSASQEIGLGHPGLHVLGKALLMLPGTTYTRQESIPSSGVFQVFAENMRVQGAEVSGEEEAWLKMVDKKMS